MDYAEDTATCNTNNEDENTADQEHSDPVQEETIFEEVHAYLSQGHYPLEATKQEKCIIRKRSKNFQLLDGVLHYKGKGGSLRQVSSITTREYSSRIQSYHTLYYIDFILVFMLVTFRWFLIMERNGKFWKPAIMML